MTFKPAQMGSILPIHQEIITLHLANAFGFTFSIYQPTIIPGPAQISSILPANLLQQPFNTSANLYTQISPIRMPNKMLPAIIID